jgi:hypothetical protein
MCAADTGTYVAWMSADRATPHRAKRTPGLPHHAIHARTRATRTRLIYMYSRGDVDVVEDDRPSTIVRWRWRV